MVVILYLYYWNDLNPHPTIEMKLKPISAYTVKLNDFPHNYFGINSARQHK